MQSMQSQFIIYKATSHYTEPHSHRTETLCAIKSSFTHYTEPHSHHSELLRTIKSSFIICRHYTVFLHNRCNSVAVECGERGPSHDTMLLCAIQGSLTRYKVFPCYTKLFPIIQICFSTRCDRHTMPEQT